MDKIDEIRQKANWLTEIVDNPYCLGPIALLDTVKLVVPYLLSEVDRLNALHKREIIVTGEYAQRVIELTARAEAAEAERDAAVGGWKAYEENGQCDVCKYGEGGGCVYPEGNRCHFEYRGTGKEREP